MIWCCPRCKGRLDAVAEGLRCEGCGHAYELVGGIPDLRVPTDAWIDFEEDLVVARELAAASHLPLEELVRSVYSRRAGWDQGRIEMRTRQVMAAPARLQRDIQEWLTPALKPDDLLLDLGCGAGMLIAAAHKLGRKGIGVDVSMTWLVVAKRMIAEWGGEPILAAAVGESLPLPDHAVDAVVSLDVIEHVRDPARYLSEIDRATAAGGQVFMTTPNRFSLTAEPHVQVWGVGWLPRPWQAAFVKWRSGKSYDDTCLMSSFGLRGMVQAHTRFRFRLVTPPVPAEEITRFRASKAALARIYNRICRMAVLRPLFLMFGPYFRVEGSKA